MRESAASEVAKQSRDVALRRLGKLKECDSSELALVLAIQMGYDCDVTRQEASEEAITISTTLAQGRTRQALDHTTIRLKTQGEMKSESLSTAAGGGSSSCDQATGQGVVKADDRQTSRPLDPGSTNALRTSTLGPWGRVWKCSSVACQSELCRRAGSGSPR